MGNISDAILAVAAMALLVCLGIILIVGIPYLIWVVVASIVAYLGWYDLSITLPLLCVILYYFGGIKFT
jgi:hypothetical protein